ncbi:MAG: hypothetical protein ACRC6T_06710 [Sarcina sp.]
MYNIVIEDNKYIQKFYKNNQKYKELIIDNINTILPILIKDKPYKIKTAYGYKYDNLTIHEYKIKLDKYTACRVAYTMNSNDILIFFISNTIIKKDFVALLEKVKGVHL